jgi:signal transduction histidine kinase
LISEKELFYEKKIDEFISSHRSLAEECQQLEEDKNTALDENERLMRLVRDLEEGSRRSGLREEGRAVLPEKLTIIKIKEQYAESLKQFQGTITI